MLLNVIFSFVVYASSSGEDQEFNTTKPCPVQESPLTTVKEASFPCKDGFFKAFSKKMRAPLESNPAPVRLHYNDSYTYGPQPGNFVSVANGGTIQGNSYPIVLDIF